MAVSIHPVPVRGVFLTYCYFVVDDATGHGLLVDAGAQPQLLAQVVSEASWSIDAILLTHGHFDHFGAAAAVSHLWKAPVWAHRESPAYLENPSLNLSGNYGPGITLPGVNTFDDGHAFPIAESGEQLLAIHVPGHTRDSVAFHCPGLGVTFVGDTAYEGGPGLTVFPTGDAQTLARSIAHLKSLIPPDALLLSGHSRPITASLL